MVSERFVHRAMRFMSSSSRSSDSSTTAPPATAAVTARPASSAGSPRRRTVHASAPSTIPATGFQSSIPSSVHVMTNLHGVPVD